MTSSAPPLRERDSVAPGPLPRVFGRYVLFDRIGHGGMADIYLARADTALGGSRLCAVKQILPALGRDEQFERLLIEEAKLAARLTHANVVQVFDLGREGDRLFIAMEYVEGFDLNRLLRALSRAKVALPAEFAIFIVREVLRGLDYAHRTKNADGRPLGLVHRDVSPSNVLISFEGEVKLCDFGIARALSAHEDGATIRPPEPSKVVGKSAYMAPEHARGEPIDARADVFAAGILLWELCAGRRLYKGSDEETLAQAKQAKIPALHDHGLPDRVKLAAVLDKALARYRDERFQSAHELLRALEDYAIDNKLMASQLRFGSFLTEHFAKEIVELRRERELAARTFSSDMPPAARPELNSMAAGEGIEGGGDENTAEPAHMGDPALFADSPSPLGAGEKNARVWSEPGAISELQRSLDSGKVALQELGIDDPAVTRAPVTQADELELERSLKGLQVLAAETQSEVRARAASAPPAAAQTEREWLWYAVAATILALGVLGYLWK